MQTVPKNIRLQKYLSKIPNSEKTILETVKSKEETFLEEKKYKLSTIGDTNWVGIDLGEIFKDVLSNEQIEQLAKICEEDFNSENDDNKHFFNIDGKNVNIKINLRQENNDESEIIRISNRLFYETKNQDIDGGYRKKYGDTYLTFSVNKINESVINKDMKNKIVLIQEKFDKAIKDNLYTLTTK